MDFSIKAFFGGDVTQLKAATDEAQGILGGFADKAKGLLGDVGASFLGAFSVFNIAEKLIGSIGEIQAQIKELRNLSREYEVSASTIQAWQAVVSKTGGEVEDANKAFARAKLSVDQLISGSETMKSAFSALGYSARDFVGIGLDDALAKIAKGYEENKDKAGAYNAIAEIFGSRTIPKIVNALHEAAGGMDDLTNKQRDGNRVFNEDSTAALDTWSKAGKSTYEFLKTGFVDWTGHVAGGFKMVGNLVNVTAATAMNALDGIKTSGEDLANGLLDGVEKLKTAQSNVAKVSEYNDAQERKARKEMLTDLETRLATQSKLTKDYEHIVALETERGWLLNNNNSKLFTEEEIKKRIAKITELDAQIEHAKSEYKQKNLELDRRAEASADERYNKASAEIEKIKFEKLPAEEQVLELQRRQEALKKTMALFDKETPIYKETELALLKNIAQQEDIILKAKKAQIVATVELSEAEKKRRAQNQAMDGSLLGIATGNQFGNLATPLLEEMYRRNQQAIQEMQYADFANPYKNPGDRFGPNASSGAIAMKQAENDNIRKNLDLRSTVLDAYKRGGYTEALQAFTGNPAQFDNFLSIITKTQTAADKQAVALDKINNTLTNVFTRS